MMDYARHARSWRPALLTALIVLGSLLAACASGGDSSSGTGVTATPRTAPAPAASPFPFVLSGSDDESVKLAKPPERIVSLSPGATETLYAIGAGHAVIGVDRFSDFPDETKALPKLEYTRPSIESLAALKPDLIITAGRQKDTLPALRDAGLPVVLIDEPESVTGVIARVRLFGRATAHAPEAEKLAASMEARVRAVSERLGSVQAGPRVYHELSGELFSATPTSFVGDLYTLLKARNIAEGGTGPYPQLSREVIVQRDPEVIVLSDGREGVTIEQVRARPAWGSISAVRAGRIYLLTPTEADMVSRPGPRVVDGLERLARLLYPERFS